MDEDNTLKEEDKLDTDVDGIRERFSNWFSERNNKIILVGVFFFLIALFVLLSSTNQNSLSVLVYDTNHTLVNDANVSIYLKSSFLGSRMTVGGRVNFDNVPADSFVLNITKEGFVSKSLHLTTSIQPFMQITLEKRLIDNSTSTALLPQPSATQYPIVQSSFSWTIFDSKSGTPIPGANVQITNPSTQIVLSSGHTSSIGIFQAMLPKEGHFNAIVSADGYVDNSSASSKIYLTPAVVANQATLLVMDSKGTVIPDASVVWMSGVKIMNTTTTNSAGVSNFNVGTSGTFYVSASKDGYIPNATQVILPTTNLLLSSVLPFCAVFMPSGIYYPNQNISFTVLSEDQLPSTLFCAKIPVKLSCTGKSCSASCTFSQSGSALVYTDLAQCRPLTLNISAPVVVPDYCQVNVNSVLGRTVNFSITSNVLGTARIDCGNSFYCAGSCTTSCNFNSSSVNVTQVQIGNATCGTQIVLGTASLAVSVRSSGQIVPNASVSVFLIKNGIPILLQSNYTNSIGQSIFSGLYPGDSLLVNASSPSVGTFSSANYTMIGKNDSVNINLSGIVPENYSTLNENLCLGNSTMVGVFNYSLQDIAPTQLMMVIKNGTIIICPPYNCIYSLGIDRLDIDKVYVNTLSIDNSSRCANVTFRFDSSIMPLKNLTSSPSPSPISTPVPTSAAGSLWYGTPRLVKGNGANVFCDPQYNGNELMCGRKNSADGLYAYCCTLNTPYNFGNGHMYSVPTVYQGTTTCNSKEWVFGYHYHDQYALTDNCEETVPGASLSASWSGNPRALTTPDQTCNQNEALCFINSIPGGSSTNDAYCCALDTSKTNSPTASVSLSIYVTDTYTPSNPGLTGSKSVTMTPNQRVFLSYSTVGTTSCTITFLSSDGSGGAIGQGNTNTAWTPVGDGAFLLPSSSQKTGVATFTITCASPTGPVTDTVTANVQGKATPTSLPASVSLSILSKAGGVGGIGVKSISISSGQDVQLSWSNTGIDSTATCTLSSNHFTNLNIVSAWSWATEDYPTSSATYTITCITTKDGTVTDTVTANVQSTTTNSPVQLSILSVQAHTGGIGTKSITLSSNQDVQLYWTSSGVNNPCTITSSNGLNRQVPSTTGGGWSGYDNPITSTTYTLTCTKTTGETTSDTVTANVQSAATPTPSSSANLFCSGTTTPLFFTQGSITLGPNTKSDFCAGDGLHVVKYYCGGDGCGYELGFSDDSEQKLVNIQTLSNGHCTEPSSSSLTPHNCAKEGKICKNGACVAP